MDRVEPNINLGKTLANAHDAVTRFKRNDAGDKDFVIHVKRSLPGRAHEFTVKPNKDSRKSAEARKIIIGKFNEALTRLSFLPNLSESDRRDIETVKKGVEGTLGGTECLAPADFEVVYTSVAHACQVYQNHSTAAIARPSLAPERDWSTSKTWDALEWTSIEDERGISHHAPALRNASGGYVPSKYLGSGSFGDVFCCQSDEDQQRCVVIKLAKGAEPTADASENAQAAEEMAHEAAMHQLAAASKSPHVIGFEGVIRSPDGPAIGVVMEFAPYGDLDSFAKGLRVVHQHKVISDQEMKAVQYTAIVDVAKGLAAVHEMGVAHLDMKPANNFLGADGRWKLADYGTSVRVKAHNDSIPYVRMGVKIENPRGMAPELIAVKNEFLGRARLSGDNITRNLSEYIRTQGTAYVKEFKDRFGEPAKRGAGAKSPGLKRAHYDALVRHAFLSRAEAEQAAFEVRPRPADAWSLGVVALTVMSGQDFMSETEHNSDVEDRLIALRRGHSIPVQKLGKDGTHPKGAIAGSTGDAKLDAAVNGLLHVDPASRPPAHILVDLYADRAGTPECRRLTIALSKITGAYEKFGSAQARLDQAPPAEKETRQEELNAARTEASKALESSRPELDSARSAFNRSSDDGSLSDASAWSDEASQDH